MSQKCLEIDRKCQLSEGITPVIAVYVYTLMSARKEVWILVFRVMDSVRRFKEAKDCGLISYSVVVVYMGWY